MNTQLYSAQEVELVANEMVNWALDNVGNPFPQSGKKFDEVIAKFAKTSKPKVKANYKVYDRKVGKFISPGHRSKSTWQSETWALNAAWDHAKRQSRSSSKRDIEKYMAENMDLYTYPVENAIVESLANKMTTNSKS